MTSFFDAQKGTRGNCLSACLAMVLKLPLEIVPHFAAMHEVDWMEHMKSWLTFGGRDWKFETDGTHLSGYYIANGPANRGIRHSVVMHDGKLFHDPHPSREGLLSVDSVWWFPLRSVPAQGMVMVPREPKEEWLRPFIMCPADEVLLAWGATLKIISKLSAAASQEKPE